MSTTYKEYTKKYSIIKQRDNNGVIEFYCDLEDLSI
jgi:hypothetical protein